MERIDAEEAAADPAPALRELEARGYALITVNGVESRSSEARDLIGSCLTSAGTPIQVFDRHPAWRPIGVDLARDPHRSEGAGVSPLHTDFVNAERPPEFVLLYCAQPDPAGGGHTHVADVPAFASLPRRVSRLLSRRAYAHGRVESLLNVGQDVNPFAVYGTDGWIFRYTGQLLHSCTGEELEAVRHLNDLLIDSTVCLELRAGDAILLDQRRVVHGRSALGMGQEQVPPSRRRLLWQRFARPRKPERSTIQS